MIWCLWCDASSKYVHVLRGSWGIYWIITGAWVAILVYVVYLYGFPDNDKQKKGIILIEVKRVVICISLIWRAWRSTGAIYVTWKITRANRGRVGLLQHQNGKSWISVSLSKGGQKLTGRHIPRHRCHPALTGLVMLLWLDKAHRSIRTDVTPETKSNQFLFK